MKEAQQRRWAKIRGETEPPAPATPVSKQPKRKLSKAGKAAIVAALKKRWATKKAEAAKAAAKKAVPAVAKKTSRKKASVKKAVKKSALSEAGGAFSPLVSDIIVGLPVMLRSRHGAAELS